MNPDDAARTLRRAASRARERPEYLGWVLARYEVMESLSEDHLRNQLHASPEDWPRLQLCLRPRGESFLPDVTRIARQFGIDRGALAAVVRHVEAVEVVRARGDDAGSLLAARTRKPPPPNPEASDDE